MTDKEKRIFEEWFEEKKEKCEVYGNGDDFWVDDEIKKFCLMGYELGLKAGRPQWHDLRKDPTDLPKEHIPVLVILESGVSDVSFVSTDKRWFCTDYYTGEDKVIAWCEIPTFDKE